ncbi:TetR/AcrR family transcriptional regulator [Sulfitobacter delicatus]|uniref:DNA-binding transcriptional regulator, AcrR family n=1 Tax=Sulfitobacter delicatus TaxID=218672 RepID=A0A1G7SKT5_9RHOB|nr:TetR/AcrR family transcriptional regulator [Sulfitobacter delicatus]SDG23561.1 DNA-binding transcriptional regulator, AcrR family [Sulfitobacter delicatus]
MPRKPNYDRADLIARARDLFWRQGWAGTSLKDLEEVLKMKPGSFYAAFGSKEALFEIALDKYAEDGAARLADLVAQHGAMEALKRYPELAICNAEAPAKACMLSKTLLELQTHGHPLAKRASAHLMGMEEQFAALFAQLQSEGVIGADHDPMALARRYQSDLLGLRVSAEREGIDAHAIAREISESLSRL